MLLVTCSSAVSQKASDKKQSLQVSARGDFNKFWKVHEAGLREGILATVAYLKVENISQTSFEHTLIYGEFFDAKGRFCYSTIFSQDSPSFSQDEGDAGAPNSTAPGAVQVLRCSAGGYCAHGAPNSIAPGAVQELHGMNWGLAPASEPTEVSLYLVRQRFAEEDSPRTWDVRMRIPVTIGGSILQSVSSLQLHPPPLTVDGTENLIYAQLRIDSRGNLLETEVLRSLSPEVEAWFRNFANQLIFYPASENGVPVADHALLLVQAITQPDLAGPTWASPLLKSYSEGAGGEQVSPVTKIVLAPPSGKVNRAGSTEWTELPPAPPGLLQVLSGGSADWGQPAFKWIEDPSAPHHLRRQLVPFGSH